MKIYLNHVFKVLKERRSMPFLGHLALNRAHGGGRGVKVSFLRLDQ
jgi:hypothetical protein